jgi:DeoR family suf operon transcriptional repressor
MQSLSLPGYRGQKAEVLIALKKSQPLTAKELGLRFDLTANALRRHLDSLEEDGVITHRVEARGVGAPVHTYSLTSKGEELFPHAYTEALSEVLEAVRRAGGGEEIIAVFRRKWEKVAADALPLLDALSFSERAQLLAELLNAEGFMAEAETPTPTSAVVRKHHCAIKAVAEHFPEICGVEQEFFQIVLGARVTREQHILEGCNHCAFTAQVDTPGPVVSA